MTDGMKLVVPKGSEGPSIPQQVFDIVCASVRQAGGFLVPHPDEHTINVVFGGQQVTITVELRDKHHA